MHCLRPRAGYDGAHNVSNAALAGKTRKALEEKRAELALTY